MHFLNSKVVLWCPWITDTNKFSVDISKENEKPCNIKRRSKHLVCMECSSHYIIYTLEIKAIWCRKQKWLLRPLLYVWDNLILYSFRISCYVTIQKQRQQLRNGRELVEWKVLQLVDKTCLVNIALFLKPIIRFFIYMYCISKSDYNMRSPVFLTRFIFRKNKRYSITDKYCKLSKQIQTLYLKILS